MFSKNIHEGSSLRDVLLESILLPWKGDHEREVREKSLSDSGRNSDASIWMIGNKRESATFEFLNLILC